MADLLETDPDSGLLSSDDEQDEVEEVQIESLVKGRAKRSTAGQHMSALIDAAADDDLTLLFEEVEDDNEFAVEEAAEDEDMGLDSSSDDDDDQGPNAQNDYEGEKQLQKDERKKRRAQNDLRFQTLRKRVKIDPTIVSAIPVPPRPKKKSERISWLPTPEDGPTRSSSRRQTVNNKEMTHARLKDSQEKRERIIATMEEAAKRKAHLKPKEMTQEDHLAEAARVERTNSKTVNRWEQAEKRKAEERRAKIEALQNRKLDGPVMSYWSGIATWADGRLTRVGKAEIKAKPEKDITKKKKSEKDEKPVVSLTTAGGPSIPPLDSNASLATPTPLNPSQSSLAQPAPVPTPSESASLPVTSPAVPSEQQTNPPTTVTGSDPASASVTQDLTNNGTSPTETTGATTLTPANQTDKPDDKTSDQTLPAQSMTTTSADPQGQEDIAKNEAEGPEATPSEEPSQPPRKSSQGYPLPIVEIVTNRKSATPATEKSGDGSKKPTPIESADRMDIDKAEVEIKADEPQSTTTANSPPQSKDIPTSEAQPAQIESSIASAPLLGQAGVQPGAPVTTPLAPHNPQTSGTPSAGAAPLPAAPPEINAIDGRPLVPGPEGPIEPATIDETPAQPDAPQPPPVIAQTGRSVTILENFDNLTAQSKKYSIYFNAKKPKSLAKISSSLCVITSLPSRYRDPETSLPYANSYAYGQIRRLQSQDYTWSGMLGCFSGPAGVAARGVPARFLGGEKSAEEIELEAKEKEKEAKEKEAKEKEAREKEAKEKEAREKAAKEKEAKEKEQANVNAKEKEIPKDQPTTGPAEPAQNAGTESATVTKPTSAEPMDVDG